MQIDGDKIHYREIPLSRIQRDENQPRKNFGDIAGLAESIRAQGLIYPIIVTPIENDRYQIIAGERRYLAHERLGLATIKATVSPLTDPTHIALVQAIENIQRKDFNPIEEARAVERLVQSGKISQKDVAKSIGVAPSNVSQLLSILRIPKNVQDELQTSEHITKSGLIELAKSVGTDPSAVFDAKVAKLKAGKLTVREARERGSYLRRIITRNYHSVDNDLKIILRVKQNSSLANEKKALDLAIRLLREHYRKGK